MAFVLASFDQFQDPEALIREIRRRKKAEREQARLDELLAAVVDEVVASPVQEPSDTEPGNGHVELVPEPATGPSEQPVAGPSVQQPDPVVVPPVLAAGPAFTAAPSTVYNTPASEVRRLPTPRRLSAPEQRVLLAPPVFQAPEPLLVAGGAAGGAGGAAAEADVSDDEGDMADMPMTWSGARGAYSVDKFLLEVKSWSMLRKSQVAKPLTSSNVLHHIMQRLLNSALWARFDHALNSNAFVADGQAGNVASREEL